MPSHAGLSHCSCEHGWSSGFSVDPVHILKHNNKSRFEGVLFLSIAFLVAVACTGLSVVISPFLPRVILPELAEVIFPFVQCQYGWELRDINSSTWVVNGYRNPWATEIRQWPLENSGQPREAWTGFQGIARVVLPPNPSWATSNLRAPTKKETLDRTIVVDAAAGFPFRSTAASWKQTPGILDEFASGPSIVNFSLWNPSLRYLPTRLLPTGLILNIVFYFTFFCVIRWLLRRPWRRHRTSRYSTWMER